MSTRATLTINDGENRFDIYRHHDGYPNGPYGVIRDIRASRALSWPSATIEAGDSAAALIATMKRCPGSVMLTKDAARHSDRAFHYELRNRNNCLHLLVYGYRSLTAKTIAPIFEGTLDEAETEFDALPAAIDIEERQGKLELPLEAATLVADALESAALDINQASRFDPDPDSQSVLNKIKMALAVLK